MTDITASEREEMASLAKRMTTLVGRFEQALATFDEEGEREARIDKSLARQLSRSMALNARLRQSLDVARHALEIVHANKNEPHIPPVALATVERAIRITDEVLKD
jgi:flagellar biosynthesis/type III secretory pathway protein FliH